MAENPEVPGILSLDSLCCSRSLWDDYMISMRGEEGILDELNPGRRGCLGFLRHRPGFKPDEHRDLLWKWWEAKRHFLLTVAGSAIGSLLAFFLAWLARRFGIR